MALQDLEDVCRRWESDIEELCDGATPDKPDVATPRPLPCFADAWRETPDRIRAASNTLDRLRGELHRIVGTGNRHAGAPSTDAR